MAKQAFQKFIVTEEKGAKKKERIRQEKKKVRQETKEYFTRKKQEARQGWIAKTDTDNKDSHRNKTDQDNSGRKKILPVKKNLSTKTNVTKPEIEPVKKQSIKGSGAVAPVKKDLQLPGNKNIEKESAPAMAGQMPLNKFIAHAGICSRRDAALIVKSGTVNVNGQTITEPGYKVSEKDEIKVNGKKITARKHLVYILINKPKDYITTLEDPEGRKTVYEIIKHATQERVYPIGRLDRNTTGVLLFTNDGDLAQKLSHPSYEVKKIYEVRLDKPLVKKDFETLLNGVTLEDGFIAPDSLAYADAKDKTIIGIEIHSGRNRIVRRIFESLGYDVRNLDRVMYANLTKKNVERGKYRFLSEKEVRLLKFMNASYSKKGERGKVKG